MKNLAVYNPDHQTLTLSYFNDGKILPQQIEHENVKYSGTAMMENTEFHTFVSEIGNVTYKISSDHFNVVIQDPQPLDYSNNDGTLFPDRETFK